VVVILFCTVCSVYILYGKETKLSVSGFIFCLFLEEND
jgi:hypothetical protein